MVGGQVPQRQGGAGVGEQQDQPCCAAQVLLDAAQRGHLKGAGVGDLRGAAHVQAGDQQGDHADAQRHALARTGVAECVPDDLCGASGQVQFPGDQAADVVLRVEGLDKRVADDQRDDRDEQVQGYHDGQVLALDLVEPKRWPSLCPLRCDCCWPSRVMPSA
jgi:hypothetical protein